MKLNPKNVIAKAGKAYLKSQGVPIGSADSDTRKILASIDRRLADLQDSVDELVKLHRVVTPGAGQ